MTTHLMTELFVGGKVKWFASRFFLVLLAPIIYYRTCLMNLASRT